MFEVDYFGRPAYLAQSPQFYKQVLVGVFERVYEVGPVFRAEPHDTVRHLAEYVEPRRRARVHQDHREVVACLRDVVAGMVDAVHDARRRGGRAARRSTSRRSPEEIPVLHFREALRIAGAPADEPDLPRRTSAHWATGPGRARQRLRRGRGLPDGQPRVLQPPRPRRPALGRSFDLIFRGTELVSGAQRLHRYDDYVRTLEERGYPYAPYASYVEAFRRGIPPHGGFAIGLERFVSRLTGLPTSVR